MFNQTPQQEKPNLSLPLRTRTRSRLCNCRWSTGSANGSCNYFLLQMLQPTREEEEDVLCKCMEKPLVSVSLKRKRAIERTAVSARCPRLTDTHGYKWNNTILFVCLFVFQSAGGSTVLLISRSQDFPRIMQIVIARARFCSPLLACVLISNH